MGILIAAVQTGIITREEADRLLHDMRRLGYRFPLDSLEGLA